MNIGEFATLEVIRTRKDGALLEWGRDELLLLPEEEQRDTVRKGDKVLVYITEDDRVYSRPMASMKLQRYFDLDTSSLKENQEVELTIFGESDLGFDAIIDNRFRGILYHNEVFSDLRRGDRLTGYVKKLRDDGKVDLMTQLRGTRGTTRLGSRILQILEENGGFMAVTDKSPPDEIYRIFGVSKKKYKMAVGRLFKHRDILIEPDGIRLSKD